MNGTLNFVLRTQKTLKNGKTPIYLTYSLHRVRLFHSLEQSLFSFNWNAETKRAVYFSLKDAKKHVKDITIKELITETEINDINSEIENVKSDIEKIEKRFIANEIIFSSQMIIDDLKAKNTVLTKKEEQKGLLFDFIDKYIEEHELTRVKGSLTVYKSVKNHLKAYQDVTNHKVTFETIDYKFFSKLQRFLINRTKTDIEGKVSPLLNNITIAKALSTLKTFLNYAKEQGIKVNDGYKEFTIKKEKLEVIALEQDEFDSLVNLNLTANKHLDKVRDLFIFSCATGFRISDVSQLRREHINNNLITLIIKKTKTSLTVPLNCISSSILNKYSEMKQPLPIMSGQVINRSLKDLCKLAGINKPTEIVRFHGAKSVSIIYPKYELISFHNGRKTFCTLSLEKGMTAEEVMKISGHEDYRSFQRYINVTEKRKKTVMTKAWGAPLSNLKIVG